MMYAKRRLAGHMASPQNGNGVRSKRGQVNYVALPQNGNGVRSKRGQVNYAALPQNGNGVRSKRGQVNYAAEPHNWNGIRSKRGQVQYYLFALLALVVFITAIYVMLGFNSDFKQSTNGLTIATNIDFYEDYVMGEMEIIFFEGLKGCSGCDVGGLKQEIIKVAGERGDIFRTREVGNLYGYLRNGQFTLSGDERGYELKVEGLFVSVEIEYSSGRRNFDYCGNFDLNGEFLGEC